MHIRVRTILVILLANVVIISFGVLIGIVQVKNDVAHSQETDLTMIADLANLYLSSVTEILHLKAAKVALALSSSDDTAWQEKITDFADQYPQFTGFAVLDSDSGLVVSAGKLPATPDVMNDPYIKPAFLGQRVFSSTNPTNSGHGVVIYLAVPIPERNHRVLVVTLPGNYFSRCLSTFSLWETGFIFICDSEGYTIATPDEDRLQERFNILRMAETDQSLTKLAEMITRMTRGETGISYYSLLGLPRACSFRPISGSKEGWSLGVIAPLVESPFRAVIRGTIFVGIVCFIFSIIAAVVASHYIKKPFDEIARLKETAEANSKFKSDFIANISHEIRTPMNAIMGITEILTQDDTLEEKMSDGLEKIYSSGDMLLNIINDILDLSKIEAGKMEVIPGNYDLASLINDTVVLNMIRFGSKPIEFKLIVDETLPSTLFGDDLRIKQILNNLLSNAYKYTEEGKVQLTFAVEKESGDQENDLSLVFSVSDTGQGMTPEQVNALFDKYARFTDKANRTIEGTGLGMNITKNLLHLMRGKISVESELYKGSFFVVRIPQKRVGSGVLGRELAEKLQSFKLDSVHQLKKTHILHEPMPYGRILVVDDLESNLYVAKGLLAPYMLSIETAVSGYQAIEKIQEGNVYDIVFMDHMMPKMDGVVATKLIRDMGYKHPIVALTANAVSGQMEMFLANGFDGFISKPIDVRHLNAVLKKFVRDKQPPEVIIDTRRQMNYSKGKLLEDATPLPITSHLAELFVRDAQKAVATLEEVAEKHVTYENEDIQVYTTCVHAMKTALENVGELKLSALASELEQAAKKKEMATLSAGTPAFLKKLRNVIAKFTPQEVEEEDSETTDWDYEYLREKLLAIKEACEVYDKKTAKDTMVALRQLAWPQAVKEQLSVMAVFLLGGDFDEVVLASNKITEIINRSMEERHEKGSV